MNSYKYLKLILPCVLTISVIGCSSGPKIQEFPASASAADEIERLSADIVDAKNSQVDVLAPKSFNVAEKSLQKAQTYNEGSKSSEDILKQVAKGRAYLDTAKRTADLANSKIENVVVARKAALDTGAANDFSHEFLSADHKLRDLTSEIEKNDFDSVEKNRLKLQALYRDLELKGLLKTKLGPAKESLEKALDEGAKKYAAQSLDKTKETINEAEAYIIANRNDTLGVETKAKEATREAEHLLKITRAAKEVDNISPEEAALRLEATSAKLRRERAALKEVSKESEQLKSQQQFNESFKKAQTVFKPNEAEIYRQQDRLVIRLKSLKFPVGQATLRESNYDVLGKVVNVLKDFENPKVVVEGHTDSDGGRNLNKKLSLERSQSVSKYFISAGVIPEQNIQSLGYGYERPLATNKSETGKAQNRRVDIIITPSPENGSF